MDVFRGAVTYQGVAIGKIQYIRRSDQYIRQYTVENAKREIHRYRRARERAMEGLRMLFRKSQESNLPDDMYKGQISLLEQESFSRAIEGMILSERVNAAYAVITNRDEMVRTFAGLEDDVVRRRVADIRDISERLAMIIEGIAREDYSAMEPYIVVASELSPTEVMEMDQEKLLAFVTKNGSPVSHTSIIAKTLSIPAIIGVEVDPLWDGKQAIVDGYEGVMYIEPDQKTLDGYREIQKKAQQEREYLLKLKGEEDITLDGTRVKLCANIGNLEDMRSVIQYGAAGVGMLRSEFQYLGRENYPREMELFRAYKKVAEAMGDKQVVVRTLDIGADKTADYMELPLEENPAMGNRGIRICLERKRMFKAQLRAIYRASAYGNLAIMYPMITSVAEIREVQEIIADVIDGLKAKDIPFKKVEQGIMVETPAAVMIADDLAREVDFLSVGTNDLSQYTLAMDRKNPSLKDCYNEHHPAIMKMIKMTVEAAHRQGRWVSICGELAGEPELTPWFLKMGVDMLSVVPPSILPIRKEIRQTNLTEVQ